MEPFHYFVDGRPRFEAFEDDGNRHARVLENLCCADLAGNTFHGGTLRPVQIRHDLRSLPELIVLRGWLAEQRTDRFSASVVWFHRQRWLCGGRSDTCIVHIIETVALNLEFEWDEANVGHIGRHDVSPQEVEQVFANGGTDLNYELVRREERWTTVGHTSSVRVLIVIWTMRGELVRVVTAFDAGKAMKAEYLVERGMGRI